MMSAKQTHTERRFSWLFILSLLVIATNKVCKAQGDPLQDATPEYTGPEGPELPTVPEGIIDPNEIPTDVEEDKPDENLETDAPVIPADVEGTPFSKPNSDAPIETPVEPDATAPAEAPTPPEPEVKPKPAGKPKDKKKKKSKKKKKKSKKKKKTPGKPKRVDPKTPVEPQPVEPVTDAPTPVEPQPVEPVTDAPKPVEPVTDAPTPVEPQPVEPVTDAPTPVEPQPVEPVTDAPKPVEPQPVEPITDAPKPVEPVTEKPVEPKPVEPVTEKPEPIKPKPVEPVTKKPEPVKPKPVEPVTKKPEPVKPKPVVIKPVEPKPVTPKPTKPPVPRKPVTQGPCIDVLTSAQKRQACPGEWKEQVRILNLQVDKLKTDNEKLWMQVTEIHGKIKYSRERISESHLSTNAWKKRVAFPGDFADVKDCNDALGKGNKKPGVYLLNPASPYNVRALCVNGWTVIQRRFDGTENFNRDFDEYVSGFGNFSGEFILGLENLHLLTKDNSYTLRIDVKGATGKWYYAVYEDFSLSDEQDQYRLLVGNMTDGNFFDGLENGRNEQFSTYERDNDMWRNGNCAQHYGGGWWSNTCNTNLNQVWCSRGCLQWGPKRVISSIMRIKPSEAIVPEDVSENPNPGGLTLDETPA